MDTFKLANLAARATVFIVFESPGQINIFLLQKYLPFTVHQKEQLPKLAFILTSTKEKQIVSCFSLFLALKNINEDDPPGAGSKKYFKTNFVQSTFFEARDHVA